MAFPEDYKWKIRIPVDAGQVDAALSDFPVKRISDHELRVAEHYVRVENFTRLETRILEKLERIEKKIDAKADKQVPHDAGHF